MERTGLLMKQILPITGHRLDTYHLPILSEIAPATEPHENKYSFNESLALPDKDFDISIQFNQNRYFYHYKRSLLEQNEIKKYIEAFHE